MEEQGDNQLFLKHINDHYTELYRKYKRFCKEKDYDWSEDIFQETIIKCHDAIERKGRLTDKTGQGIENYFFKSFKQNLQREKQYARNVKRDGNITSDNINDVYETWYNRNNQSSESKLKSDLFKDFATLYIMHIVEKNFNEEHFYLFKLKNLCEMTYKELSEKTGIKGSRQKVVDVKTWLRNNVKKEDIKEAFYDTYKNIL